MKTVETVEAFLARGGKINNVATGETALDYATTRRFYYRAYNRKTNTYHGPTFSSTLVHQVRRDCWKYCRQNSNDECKLVVRVVSGEKADG